MNEDIEYFETTAKAVKKMIDTQIDSTPMNRYLDVKKFATTYQEQIQLKTFEAEHKKTIQYRKLEDVSHKIICNIIDRLELNIDKRLKLYDYFNDKLNCASMDIKRNGEDKKTQNFFKRQEKRYDVVF